MSHNRSGIIKLCLKTGLVLLFISLALIQKGYSQTAYFIDGYHGGIWGHYPDWNTRFMEEQLKSYPDWKINLEIEPVTWADAMIKDSAAYNSLKDFFKDQSPKTERIEYVNPDYAQSYLFNIEGESIIRQFEYGIKTIRQHFPEAKFPVYSSEEPCFTSALPQILLSFGFKYASLKNPNTCWGGYTTAHGGEIVNWVGPDGSKIITSPRYKVEALQPGSTWQTIASNNSPAYINACFAAGIQHPIGMTLQDAGWKNGPIIRTGAGYQPTETTTWANYFENVAIKSTNDNWKFTQEDVLVSLVWGSQILQQIAQKVRVAENKLIRSEKLAAMAKMYNGIDFPQSDFDTGWKPLLLSQHHDCWIVPYNTSKGNSWADKVTGWTAISDHIADSLVNDDLAKMQKGKHGSENFIRVYNTLGIQRNEITSVIVSAAWEGKNVTLQDKSEKLVHTQIVADSAGTHRLLFNANVPSMGYNTYRVKFTKAHTAKNLKVTILNNGNYKLENDLYIITLDPEKGGIIKNLIAKSLNNKEFVDPQSSGLNELRGNFYDNGGMQSSSENPATVSITENGPVQSRVEIKGTISGSPFTQYITLTKGQRRIDFQVKIDWKGNPGIGEGTPKGGYKTTGVHKAFYNDKQKLLLLFPLNLKSQQVYKNAPFDVLKSRLDNTFFNSWDSIKNNIILNWVDVTDNHDNYGLALITDHTSNYTHGKDFPLGLTLAYSGVGLWGRDYKITGPTNVHYALVPHAGKWDKSKIWTEGTKWNEPLIASISQIEPKENSWQKSMLSLSSAGYEITSLKAENNDLIIRVFNAEGSNTPVRMTFDGLAAHADLVELNGQIRQKLKLQETSDGKSSVLLSIPRLGLNTIILYSAKAK
jgi:alpha-mannosidase